MPRYCETCPHTERDHALGPLVGCSLGMTDPGCACCLGLERDPRRKLATLATCDTYLVGRSK